MITPVVKALTKLGDDWEIPRTINCGSEKPRQFMSLGKSPPATIQTAC